MRKLRLFLLFLVLIFSFLIYQSYEVKSVDVDIDEELRKVATKEYLQKNILNSKENEEEFFRYVELAKYLNISLNEETKSLIDEKSKEEGFFSGVKEFASDSYDGFVLGKMENEKQFYLSIASDFSVVGDARDFYKEGIKFTNDEEYNKLIFALSAVGLALTATHVTTLGATTPLKLGTATLKVAVKSGRLSKEFIELLSKRVSKAVDFKHIKQNIRFSSFDEIKSSSLVIKNSINFSPLKKVANNISTIKANSSLYDTTKLLKYIDSEKDMKKLVKISSKYKSNSVIVMKILGKGVLKATKSIVKFSTWFFLELVALVISFMTLIFSYLYSKVILKLFRLVK